ncbi:MAG: flagellar motor switch protein FliM [Gammaproteobacteria bacterium]|nr:flagellar motor switch protein FliM [Gammaproteobacteria bacterium]NNM19981.1 flagellar motor switch protein FliM [Gammaproteobacteria bacterium]
MTTESDTPREEILSQEETDALLQGIDEGSVPTESGTAASGSARLYDFADCERLARGAMPTLQIINNRIARRLRDSLSELLRRPVEVEAEPNVAVRFGEHVPTFTLPACLNLVRVAPLPGTMLVVPDVRMVYMTVDCFFGGRGKVPENPEPREFTQVEQRMVSLLLERVFEAVSDGWEPVMELEPELIGQEQNPQFAAIASSRDEVIVSRFIAELAGENLALEMIMPRALLEPIEESLDSAPRTDAEQDDGHWTAAVRERLETTQIGLHSTLTRTTLRLGDVLSLQPGDVIPVDLPDQVVLRAAGTPVFAARIGVSRNRNAVEIIAPAEPESSQN